MSASESFACCGQNGVIECADVEVVWEASDDDAMVRAEWEPNEVAESHISGQDGKAMGPRVGKDRVVRLTTQAEIADILDRDRRGSQHRGE